jgi:hypothetical protein
LVPGVEPARQVEVALLEICQPRTQVEPKELRERHRKMREAMGIDRHAFDAIDLLLPQGTLDRRPCLPAVDDDRLVVKNAPLIEDVGVGADGIGEGIASVVI